MGSEMRTTINTVILLSGALCFLGCSHLTIDNDSTKTQVFMYGLKDDLNLYKKKCGSLPESQEEFQNLLDQPCAKALESSFVSVSKHNRPIVDLWSRPIIYNRTEIGYSLISLGKDGVPGGKDQDADIVMPVEQK